MHLILFGEGENPANYWGQDGLMEDGGWIIFWYSIGQILVRLHLFEAEAVKVAC